MPIVDVIAPASACSDERLAAGVATLERWGLQPRVPSALFVRGKRGMFANTDEARLAHLVAALRAPDSRLLWCVRGGYGSLRLLEKLSKTRLPDTVASKVLLGFSDVSALQLMSLDVLGVQAMHAPVLAQLGCSSSGHRAPLEIDVGTFARTRAMAIALAKGEAHACSFPKLKPMNEPARADRQVRGKLLGTNLRTVQTLAGTGWLPAGRGVIWCFEDVGERGYEVDRALVQLALSGAFTGARAVIFGTFTGGEEPGARRSVVPQALRRFAANVKFPVLQGLPIGHSRRNWPVPIGSVAHLSLGSEAVLSVAI